MTETRRPRRSNAEILEDLKKERAEREAAKKAAATKRKAPGQKRVRRTKAQIEADNRAEAEAREILAQERASKIPAPKVPKFRRTIHFVEDGLTALGNVWEAGDVLTIEEGDQNYEQAFRDDGTFIFNLTPDEQVSKWGHVKYYQDELPDSPSKAPQSVSKPRNNPQPVFAFAGTEQKAVAAVVDEDGIRKSPTFSSAGIVHDDSEYADLYDGDDLLDDPDE